MTMVQTQGCELFILIKKRVDVFLQMVVRVLATRVGRTYVQIGKAIYSLKNKKLKRTMYRLKK